MADVSKIELKPSTGCKEAITCFDVNLTWLEKVQSIFGKVLSKRLPKKVKIPGSGKILKTLPDCLEDL